jgi:predicted dehydrogenase
MSSPETPDRPVTRRTFVARATGLAAAAVAASAAPAALSAASYARVRGANARVRLGVIGTGGRGRSVMASFLRHPELVDVVALCDVYRPNLDRARQAAPNGKPYADYRALLDARDVDAVLVATPDHWHARNVVDAARAGKDVYVEKPMAHTPEEGREIVRAARDAKRVVQVGLQQRSGPHYLQAKREYFESGRIGKVPYVRTWWHGNTARVVTPRYAAQPDTLDWRQWVGPRAMRPFDSKQFQNWRSYFDFGGGTITDLFTHWIDVAHWFLGEDLPNAAVAAGGIYQYADGRDAPDTVNVLLDYPGGWTASFEATLAQGASGAAVEFLGTEGSLYIDRDRYTFTPPGRDAQPVTVRADGDQTHPHVENFLACVRSRATPTSDPLSGYRSCLATLLGKRAYVEKARATLDVARERSALGG